MKIFNFSENVDLKDYSLILTSVSVGNVPQLAVDLFITNYNLKKISTVWHPAIVPCVGSDPYFNSTEVCTACELYINKDLKIVVMQLRSTLEPKQMNSFFNDLKNEFNQFNLKRIIILTSIFDYELHAVESNKFFYISNESKLCEGFNNLQQFEKDFNGKYFLNGGGFALKCYETLNNKCCCIIGKYVSEGDNRPDAYSLLLKILPILGVKELKEFVCPSSWKYVFGGPAPLGIF